MQTDALQVLTEQKSWSKSFFGKGGGGRVHVSYYPSLNNTTARLNKATLVPPLNHASQLTGCKCNVITCLRCKPADVVFVVSRRFLAVKKLNPSGLKSQTKAFKTSTCSGVWDSLGLCDQAIRFLASIGV